MSNIQETEALEEVDPGEAFAAMGFPVAETAESIAGTAQDSSIGIGDDAVTGAVAHVEVEVEHSQETDDAWRFENHLLRPEDVDSLCAKEQSTGGSGVIAGLIPRRNVTFLIGDSGLGKSPLAYQLGLCVAAGIPFIGMDTFQGTVVYADYENGLEEGRELRERLVRFLELPESPKNFLIWTPDLRGEGSIDLERTSEGKPLLLIIDTVRSHSPQFEKTEHAGEQMKQLNRLAHKYGVAILAIHHLRKPGENGVPLLDNDDTGLILWLKQTAGHSSIINQSHTRIAVDSPDGRKKLDAALILRWHRRVKGECGPLYLERVYDASGEPLGYQRLSNVSLLGKADQEDAFRKLPNQFSFKEAKEVYSRSDDPTRKWLQKCVSLGLVRQVAHGRYERTDNSSGSMTISSGPTI